MRKGHSNRTASSIPRIWSKTLGEDIQKQATPPAVAFLVQAPFSQRDVARYGIERLRANRIAIKIIDTSMIANPGGRFGVTNEKVFGNAEVSIVTHRDDLDHIKTILDDASLVVCEVGSGFVDYHTLPILRHLSRSSTPYLIPSTTAIPTSDRAHHRPSLFRRVRSAGLIRPLLNRVPLAALGLRIANYVVFGGSRSYRPMPLVGPGTTTLWSQATDQDIIEDEIAARPVVPITNIAVFLDQYFGFHPGAFVHGFQHAVDSHTFYPLLRRLFDRIEAELGLSVVIAAHPRADYTNKSDIFGPRPIIYGKTARLVRESRLAICSFSTAAGLAVLCDKPLLIYTLPSITNLPYVHDAPGALAKALGRITIDISDPDALTLDTGLFTVDHEAYRRYRERYIKSDRASGERLGDILLRLCLEATRTKSTIIPPQTEASLAS